MDFTDLFIDLKQELIAFNNDAKCFALAESLRVTDMKNATDVKKKRVFGIILGTGVGGAMVENGKIVDVQGGFDGEWGHFSTNGAGRPCHCGNIGCLKTVLSGPDLQQWAEEQGLSTQLVRELLKKKKWKNSRRSNSTLDALGAEKSTSYISL